MQIPGTSVTCNASILRDSCDSEPAGPPELYRRRFVGVWQGGKFADITMAVRVCVVSAVSRNIRTISRQGAFDNSCGGNICIFREHSVIIIHYWESITLISHTLFLPNKIIHLMKKEWDIRSWISRENLFALMLYNFRGVLLCLIFRLRRSKTLNEIIRFLKINISSVVFAAYLHDTRRKMHDDAFTKRNMRWNFCRCMSYLQNDHWREKSIF